MISKIYDVHISKEPLTDVVLVQWIEIPVRLNSMGRPELGGSQGTTDGPNLFFNSRKIKSQSVF